MRVCGGSERQATNDGEHDGGEDFREPPLLAKYNRAAWRHWDDADDDGQDTREEVLRQESLEPVEWFVDRSGKRRLGGRWVCPYTGEILQNARDLDIDHLVPLKEAHESGGYAWDAATRAAFANDLLDPDHLVAVVAKANRQKGAKDPADWMPENNRCAYAIAWVRVKRRWQLDMDRAEQDAVLDAIAECPAQFVQQQERKRNG